MDPLAGIALTIAGFDPSSGAGITADLAVFAAHGFFGISAITALTVQSTIGVRALQPVSAEFLRETLACLQDDLPPRGIKIGMLGGAEQVRVVADYLRAVRSGPLMPTVVLDPVLRSSSGAALLSDAGQRVLLRDLLPLVDVVTPNRDELAVLTGLPAREERDAVSAAAALSGNGTLSVLVTGGDCPKPDDLLWHRGTLTRLEGERIETRATHGTGCALSSSLLAHLLRGFTPADAALAAKQYVAQAMRRAAPLGRGNGPLRLL